MQLYNVAVVLDRDQKFILVVVDKEFGDLGQDDRAAFIQDIEERAKAKKMTGTVVPVWHIVGPVFGHAGPPSLDEYFRSWSWTSVEKSLKWELYRGSPPATP